MKNQFVFILTKERLLPEQVSSAQVTPFSTGAAHGWPQDMDTTMFQKLKAISIGSLMRRDVRGQILSVPQQKTLKIPKTKPCLGAAQCRRGTPDLAKSPYPILRFLANPTHICNWLLGGTAERWMRRSETRRLEYFTDQALAERSAYAPARAKRRPSSLHPFRGGFGCWPKASKRSVTGLPISAGNSMRKDELTANFRPKRWPFIRASEHGSFDLEIVQTVPDSTLSARSDFMQGRGILLPQEEAGTVLIASRSEEPEYARLVQAVTETRPDLSVVHLSGEVRRCAHVALQSARKVGIHIFLQVKTTLGTENWHFPATR
jgi:hypothetical protein